MEYLYIEETELIYTDLSEPNPPTVNLAYSSINTIFYGIRTRKLLFGLIKLPERHLTIRANGRDYRILQHNAGKEKLEEYTEAVKAFAHKHRVTIRETTGDSDEDYRL